MKTKYTSKLIRTGIVCVFLLTNATVVTATEDSCSKDLIIEANHKNRPFILFVHGINNNITIFNDFKSQLNSLKFNLAFLTLAGHSGCEKDKYTADSKTWLLQVDRSLKYIKTTYSNPQILGFGYSLGGLVLVTSELISDTKNFEKLILLAPALKVHGYTRLVTLLTPLSDYNLALPSLAPKEYLAYPDTALSSYQALFDLLNEFEASEIVTEKLPDTLVIVHRDDLLVSSTKLRQFIDDNQLQNWQFYERKDELIWPHYTYHHIFARQAFTLKAWNFQMQVLEKFLNSS